MSVINKHLAEGLRGRPRGFYRARPQVLRVVLQTLERALANTIAAIGNERIYEPRFTRQLLIDFERARDQTPGTPRYDITHQPELPIADSDGVVSALRRLDFRLLFVPQVGRTGDYLCIEFKYLEVTDRSTDREYVGDGVERIVVGDYARNHPWAIMVGLERVGPLLRSVQNVNSRLLTTYGHLHGLRIAPDVKLPHVYASQHEQGGGPHEITIIHAFYLILSEPKVINT